MATNERPQFGSDSTKDESNAKINGEKPKQPDPYLNQDFKEDRLVPSTPQKSPSISSVPKQANSLAFERTKNRPLWQMWQLWGILLVLCSGGVGYGATTMLLKLPKTQSCSKVFWPIASASIRLYCAQTAAEESNVAGLLSAIDLVAVLPENHPLRPEIDRNIDRWATGILTIAEEEFQAGNLKGAIATANKIPPNLSAKEIVDEKIASWNSVWTKGEETYQQVENKLREADWNGAFNWAVRLTDSTNEYWATTKYEESINNINVAQEENASLSKAQTKITNGNIEDLILAIDKADDIDSKSYAYEQAQEIIAEGKEKLVANIEQLIERRDWQQLLRITPQIPRSLNLQKRSEDWQILANAGSSAQLDTVFGIEEAIEEVEKLDQNSEYYQLGQKLTRRWKLEINDVRHLSKARDLARVGTIANLSKAISEAKLIPDSNPRYREASQEIKKWRGQIQIIEDRPILNRAKELAYGNNVNAWRRAIAEVNLISPGSPLYKEARDYARIWREDIQRVEDQPILDEADSFANFNNYVAAIDAAKKIKSGRALYSDAQSRITRWQEEIDGERYISEANELARRRTPEALARAIKTARQAATTSSVYPQVVRDVNDWAAEILAMARQASDFSLEEAIAIAQQVPSGTTSFSRAQDEIKIWQIRLEPRELEAIPPTFKLDKLKKEREGDD
ncbi:MAG: chromosome segregation ATPase [Pleurocapsa sp. MO_226.B13]|nr:chromosome segregation ATPase [Pleurocapsa sp. MO_226.B13]